MRLYGVTIDSVDSLDDIMQSLQFLSRMPTTRVVFDAACPRRTTRSSVRAFTLSAA